jgi:hypothetical protein
MTSRQHARFQGNADKPDATALTGFVFRFAGSGYISEAVSSFKRVFKEQSYEAVFKEQPYE